MFSDDKDSNKNVRRNKQSSERLSSTNRVVGTAEAQPNKEERRRPPGFLANLPVKQVIRTSVSREKELFDDEMKSDKSGESSSPLDDDMLKEQNKPVGFLICLHDCFLQFPLDRFFNLLDI